MIESGADINNRTVDGRTPLHTFYNEVIYRVLLCHADAIEDASVDDYGMSLVHFLAWSSKSRPQQLEPYASKGLSCLMAEDGERRSVLHFAAQRGNIHIVEYLLGLPVAVNVKSKDTKGRSVLHYSVESKRIEVLDKIVARGGDIHATDYSGRTVLHHAVIKGNLAAAKKLIELGAGADLRSVDRNGRTPLELAIIQGSTAIADYLGTLQSISPIIHSISTDVSQEVYAHERSDEEQSSSQLKGYKKHLDLKDDSFRVMTISIVGTIILLLPYMMFYSLANSVI